MRVLQLSVHFHPNLGGVETHLTDLTNHLSERGDDVFVLTYRPLSTKTSWKIWESGKNLRILRLPWLPGLFYKFVTHPILQLIYLVPGIFIAFPFTYLFFRPQVVHAHGLVSGLVAVFWSKILSSKTIISTHSFYSFPSSGVYFQFARWIFNGASTTLCLSNKSKEEIINLGVNPDKVKKFTYWLNLENFKPTAKQMAKQDLGWKDKFIVLYVGRLVAEKGILELVAAAKNFKQGISLKIAGSGPMEHEVTNYYLGRIPQSQLPVYYSASDVVIVPSVHEEGFGRVIMEALACGTPVIASNRGAIPEAMNETVGKIISISSDEIAKTVNDAFTNHFKLNLLAKNTRKYALINYSNNNANQIISVYDFVIHA